MNSASPAGNNTRTDGIPVVSGAVPARKRSQFVTVSENPPPGDGERAGRSAIRTRIVNVLQWTLLIVVVAAAVYAVYVNWTGVAGTIAEMNAGRLGLSLVVVMMGIIASTLSWQTLLDDLGKPIGVWRGGQIYLVGMLGKYVPGSIWAYVLQLELGRRAGLPRARVFAATMFSIMVAAVASLLTGALAIAELVGTNENLAWLRWLYLLLPIGLVVLYPKVMTYIVRVGFRVLRRPQPDHPITFPVVAKALGFAVLSYSLYGVHLWLLADTREGITLGPLALCIGAMGIAMIAGLVAFLLPSGAGARELVIVAALAPFVGAAPALAFALISRLLFTVSELAMAGVSALVAVIARRREGPYRDDVAAPEPHQLEGDAA